MKSGSMPRKSAASGATSPATAVETTAAAKPVETETKAVKSQPANADGDDDLELLPGFGPSSKDEGKPPSTRKPPERSKERKTDGKREPKRPAAPAKTPRRQKPATMAGRAAERPRKLAAEILRYWFATGEGEAPAEGQPDARKVNYMFTSDRITELLRLPGDDELERKENRHSLAADLRAHFESVEGKGKWKVNTPVSKQARTEAERVEYVRIKIAQQLGSGSPKEVPQEKIVGALVQVGLAPSVVNLGAPAPAPAAPAAPAASTVTPSPAPATSAPNTSSSGWSGSAVFWGLVVAGAIIAAAIFFR